MRTTIGIAVLLATCGAIGMQVRAQQEMRPTPGPGSGKMAVDVVTIPTVQVTPVGEWRTTVANVPDVRVVNTPDVLPSAPEFVRSGRRYEIVWPGGGSETVSVAEVGRGGWIRVDDPRRRRWLNVGAALSLEELTRE